jgi:hypothetical protein
MTKASPNIITICIKVNVWRRIYKFLFISMLSGSKSSAESLFFIIKFLKIVAPEIVHKGFEKLFYENFASKPNMAIW